MIYILGLCNPIEVSFLIKTQNGSAAQGPKTGWCYRPEEAGPRMAPSETCLSISWSNSKLRRPSNMVSSPMYIK